MSRFQGILIDGFRQLAKAWRHPVNRSLPTRIGSILRIVYWQVAGRLGKQRFTRLIQGNLSVALYRGLAAREIYFYQWHEYEELRFIARVMRPEDRLIDVGANAGVFSLVAAHFASCEVDAFEPMPAIAHMLEDNVKMNGLENLVHIHRCAVGSAPGSINLSSDDGPMTHRILSGDGVEVPVVTLDGVLTPDTRCTILKVDVEGLETEVIDGARQWLASSELVAVLLETAGHGTRYGHDEQALHQRLLAAGFNAVRFLPERDDFVLLERPGSSGNTLYVRSITWAKTRCRHSAPWQTCSARSRQRLPTERD